MKLLAATILAALFATTVATAEVPLPPQDQQQLPPPLPPQQLQQQPIPGQGPQLQPPQQANNVAPNGAAPQDAAANNAAQPKKAGKPPEFFKARRELLAARKQAAKDRLRQFKADRAAAEQKAYEEWHERYLADAPVRAELVRAEVALTRDRFAYYAYQPVYVPVYPIYPVYTPIFSFGYQPFYGPIYGQFWCGW
jgi:hypothetical protein